MSFKDIFKKSFLEGYAGAEITTFTVVVAMAIACALALYIFLVYRVITRKTFYSKNFNISLAGITVITSALILTMQSSVVLSLGMVGALSIVRFRTAIKDPMDLLFLFWSIGTGIICGAGLYKIAIILAVLVTVGILVLEMLPVRISPYLLIINADSKEVEDDITGLIKELKGTYKMKSKNLTQSGMDLILEVRTKNDKELVNRVSELKGITCVSLLAHDGEVKG